MMYCLCLSFVVVGTQCSPSQGQCCDRTCSFVPASANQQCKEDGECNGKAFCNGLSAKCPPPPNNPDGTECNGNTQVCQNGECSGSICSKFGMKECFLTSNVIDDKRKLCELACQIGNDNTTCKGTSELASITQLPIGISLRPGSPCDNYQVGNSLHVLIKVVRALLISFHHVSANRVIATSFSSVVRSTPKVLWLDSKIYCLIGKLSSP